MEVDPTAFGVKACKEGSHDVFAWNLLFKILKVLDELFLEDDVAIFGDLWNNQLFSHVLPDEEDEFGRE